MELFTGRFSILSNTALCLLSRTVPVSLGYKFAFMLLFVGVFMISDDGDFKLSHLKTVWMVRKLRVVVWTHAFIFAEKRKRCSVFLERFLTQVPSCVVL